MYTGTAERNVSEMRAYTDAVGRKVREVSICGCDEFCGVGGPNVMGRSLCFSPATNAGGWQKRVLLPGCDAKG